jgi:hypothetical protein
MHSRYQEWLSFVFDHEVTDPQWHFQPGTLDFDGTETDYAVLIADTFQNSGRDLRRFSDAHVNQGLWMLVSPSGGDFIFSLRDGSAPLTAKVNGIRSVFDLYKHCLAPRCTQVLGHCNQSGSSPLNSICYMFWDICPLICLEEAAERSELADAVFRALEKTLEIEHRACREGALHGLGHFALYYPERAKQAIDRFMQANQIDPILMNYAESAARAGVL